MTFLFLGIYSVSAQCPDHDVCEGQKTSVNVDDLAFCDDGGQVINGNINQNLSCQDEDGNNCFEFRFFRSENSVTESFTFDVGQGNGCNGELDASYFIYDGTTCQALSDGGSQTEISFDFPTGVNEVFIYLCVNSNANVSMCDVCRERPPCIVDITCKDDIDYNGSYCVNDEVCELPDAFTDPNDVFNFVETSDFFPITYTYSDSGETNCTDNNGNNQIDVTRTYTLKYIDGDNGEIIAATCDQQITIVQNQAPDVSAGSD
ncbi:MAG: hypothetical protein KC469_07880, partial [Flavobacteriaceae bacterium]|nr:hypothetical protein [Flavobacteriaceae bacterium]